MHSFIWKGLIGVAFTGGLMALGAGVAHADTTTSGDDGTGSGSQAVIGLNLPITMGGNAISVLGDSSSTGSSATPPSAGSASTGTTTGTASLLGGTQALVDAHAPITVSGNAISVIGDSGTASSSVGSSGSSAGQSATGSGSTAPAGGPSTSGGNAILGGTQAVPSLTAPVTASGDAISVIGDSSSSGAPGGTTSGNGSGAVGGVETSIPAIIASGGQGFLGGSQLAPVVAAPITLGRGALSVIGDGSATSGNPGSVGGSVGGVEITAPTLSTAALSVQSLATSGVAAGPALALGILLLIGGIAVRLRTAAVRS